MDSHLPARETGTAPVESQATLEPPAESSSWIRRTSMLTSLGAAAALSMVGAQASAGPVRVVVGEADWYADETVAAENMFNDPAPEGTTYVMVPVKLTNVAAGDVAPRETLSVSYVAPDGRAFQPTRQVVPEDLDEVPLLHQGDTVTGNVLFAIPMEAQQGGTWVVEVDNGDQAHFVAL